MYLFILKSYKCRFIKDKFVRVARIPDVIRPLRLQIILCVCTVWLEPQKTHRSVSQTTKALFWLRMCRDTPSLTAQPMNYVSCEPAHMVYVGVAFQLFLNSSCATFNEFKMICSAAHQAASHPPRIISGKPQSVLEKLVFTGVKICVQYYFNHQNNIFFCPKWQQLKIKTLALF